MEDYKITLRFLERVSKLKNKEKKRKWYKKLICETDILSFFANRRLLGQVKQVQRIGGLRLYNIVIEFCCKDIVTFTISMSAANVNRQYSLSL